MWTQPRRQQIFKKIEPIQFNIIYTKDIIQNRKIIR